MDITPMHQQLIADVEATNSFLLAALARGDSKAVKTWQATLIAAQAARDAVGAYLAALED